MADGGPDGSLDPICGLPLSHDTAEEIAHEVAGLGRVVLFAGLRRHLAPPAPASAARNERGAAGRPRAAPAPNLPSIRVSNVPIPGVQRRETRAPG